MMLPEANQGKHPLSDVEVSIETVIGKIDTLEQSFTADLAVTLRYQDGDVNRKSVARLAPWPSSPEDAWTPGLCTWNEYDPSGPEVFSTIHEILPGGYRILRYSRQHSDNYLLEFGEFPFDHQRIELMLLLDPEPKYVLKEVCIADLETEFEIVKIEDRHEQTAKIGVGSFGITVDKFIISIIVRRHPRFYLLNFFLVTYVLVLLQCTCIGINIDDLSARIQTTLSLLLTLAAFKISVATQVPKSTEQTVLDKQVMYAFVFLALGAMQSLLISFEIADNAIMEEMDIYFTLGYGLAWTYLNHKLVKGKKAAKFERKPGMLLPNASCAEYNLERTAPEEVSRSYWVRRGSKNGQYATF